VSGLVPRHGLSRNTKRLVFDALFQRQQGKCFICGISQDEILERYRERYERMRQDMEGLPAGHPARAWYQKKIDEGPAPVHRKLHIDHCHWTGRIRGLLCETCNLLLGNVENYGFQEKPEGWPEEDFTRTLESAGRWIEKYQERLFAYMQYERWLPTKDIVFHLQEVSRSWAETLELRHKSGTVLQK